MKPDDIIAPVMEGFAAPVQAPGDRVRAAARELEARVRPAPKDCWWVSGGTWLASNPNEAAWKIHVSQSPDGGWIVAPVSSGPPWTRARRETIGKVRAKQLYDLLHETRKLAPHERHPFHAGTAAADRCRAFSRRVAEAALSMGLVLIVLTAAGAVAVDRFLPHLMDRAEVLSRVNVDPLPRAGEVLALGFWDRVGAGFLLALPIAFCLGAIHAGLHGLGAFSPFLASFAPWTSAFLFLATTGMLWPRMPPWLALPFGLAVPAIAILGTSLVWGRGRDVLREAPAAPGRKWWPIVGGLLVAATAAVLLVPSPRSLGDRVEATALFRDRFLLGNPLGRAYGRFYYRYTLYGAEMLKEVYSPAGRGRDGTGYERQQRTVLVVGDIGGDFERLKERDFAIEVAADAVAAAPLIARRQHDLYVLASSIVLSIDHLRDAGLLRRTIAVEGPAARRPRDMIIVPILTKEDARWHEAIRAVTRFNLLEGLLPELTGYGNALIFHAGPLFGLTLILGVLAAILAPLFARSATAGRAGVACVGVASVGALVALFVSSSGSASILREIRQDRRDHAETIEVLTRGMRHADPSVRHEAVYRAYQVLRRTDFPRGALVEPLMKAGQDPEVRVRLWAAPALGRTREESARRAILAALEDPEIFVRYRAAQGLGQLDSPAGRSVKISVVQGSVERLRRVIRTASWYEGLYALEAIREMIPGTL